MAKDEYVVNGIKLHPETVRQLMEIAEKADISLEHLLKLIEKGKDVPKK